MIMSLQSPEVKVSQVGEPAGGSTAEAHRAELHSSQLRSVHATLTGGNPLPLLPHTSKQKQKIAAKINRNTAREINPTT